MAGQQEQRRAGKIEIGRLSLDLHRAVLQLDGENVSLRPQSFEVLRILAENSGELVEKRELVDEVWGDVAVTDDSLIQCLADIRRALSDTDKTIVRTIPRRGYVLEGDLLASDEEPDAGMGSPNRLTRAALAAAVVFGVLALWQFLSTPGPEAETPANLSIAVLPFADMTASQDQRHLAEGIAEEVLNLLTSSSDLKVIARTSSFSVARSGADIETIGERLGVSHVLEGSVRQGDGRLRISVQLVDAQSSEQIWSDSYDRPAGDILDIQSDIARSVASALHVQLALAPGDSAAPNPYAHSLVIQARSLNRMLGPDGGASVAKELLRRALELDPDNVDAITELSRSELLLRGPEESAKRYTQWEKAIALIDRALALDPMHAVANAWKGWHEVSYYAEYESGARYIERAMAVDPRNSDVLFTAINASTFFGQYDLGVALGKYVVDRDPFCINCGRRLSQNAMLLGDFDLAESELHRLLPLVPQMERYDIYVSLADIYLYQNEPARALQYLSQAEFESPAKLENLVLANYQLGRLDEYERLRSEFIDLYGDERPETVAALEAAAGKVDSAFTWLDRNLAQPTRARGLNVGVPFFESLHGDPRWVAYLEEMKMTPEQRAAVRFDPRLPF